MADNAKWYVVHTYSSYENSVASSIMKAVENRHMQDLIHEVKIPMETVTEITDNGPKVFERKVFPGYVLVKMVMTDESWYIIKNVRGYLTDECDIIRILNRGGAKIYNVQIANVVDITPEGQKGRALAAIRIGDICDYQSRRNELGETKNITVRDVVTHSRFGLYIADTLSDSVFENIQMTNGIGVGAYFNGCTLRNVYIDKFLYSAEAVAREDDIGYEEKFHRVKIDEINAFHFNNCTAENLNIANVVTGKGLKYVFGGNSPITVKATNIVTQDEGTALSTCAVIA